MKRNIKNILKKQDKPKADAKYPLEYLLPLIAILAFIPLIVWLYIYRTGLHSYSHINVPDVAYDFFLHTKMLWLYGTFLCIFFLIIYRIFFEKEKPFFTPILLPMFLYGLFCLVSAFFSIHTHFSFFGSYDQFENVWILLGYPLLIYYAAFTVSSGRAVCTLIPFFNTGVALMSILGMLQASGFDPYYYPPLQRLFVHHQALIGRLTSNFEKGRVYLSLYNPNYVGFYVILILPVLTALFFHARKKTTKAGYAILMTCQLIILFASQSRAGIFILCVLCLAALIFFRAYVFRNKFFLPVLFFVLLLSFAAVNFMSGNRLIKRLSSMFRSEETNRDLESIVTGKDVTITYKGNSIHFRMDKDFHFSLTDDQKKKVAFTPATKSAPNIITDERFPFSFQKTDSGSLPGFWVKTPKIIWENHEQKTKEKTWNFVMQQQKTAAAYYIKSENTGKLFRSKKHEPGISFLEAHASLANKRGFIWARTIPLLKKYFLFGSGPDTFLLIFPNADLVGLMNSGHDNEIVTKPHCMYLQIGTQTGVPSLLAFLCFFLWYLADGIRFYKTQDFKKLLPKLGMAVCFSVAGYLLMGLTNDSCIAVSPVFYALAGIGLGIRRCFLQ